MSELPSTDVKVRQASGGDAQRLSLVASATFLETFAGVLDGDALVAHCAKACSADHFARVLAADGKAWLAEANGAPVGYALLTAPELDAARDGDIELKKIYLLSRFHGGGLARELFAAALAATHGYQRLLLGVKDDNHRAIAFYAKQGFTQIGTRQYDVGGTLYDDIVMARDLNRN